MSAIQCWPQLFGQPVTWIFTCWSKPGRRRLQLVDQVPREALGLGERDLAELACRCRPRCRAGTARRPGSVRPPPLPRSSAPIRSRGTSRTTRFCMWVVRSARSRSARRGRPPRASRWAVEAPARGWRSPHRGRPGCRCACSPDVVTVHVVGRASRARPAPGVPPSRRLDLRAEALRRPAVAGGTGTSAAPSRGAGGGHRCPGRSRSPPSAPPAPGPSARRRRGAGPDADRWRARRPRAARSRVSPVSGWRMAVSPTSLISGYEHHTRQPAMETLNLRGRL